MKYLNKLKTVTKSTKALTFASKMLSGSGLFLVIGGLTTLISLLGFKDPGILNKEKKR